MSILATIPGDIPPSAPGRGRRAARLTLLAGLAVALAGCSVPDPDGKGANVVSKAAQGGGNEASGDAAVGTRQNPVPAGTTVEIGDWQVTFGPTNLNANQQVADENPFNKPPATGRQFVLAPIEVTYAGDKSGTAWLDLSITFLGSGGNTFGGAPDDYCGVIPSPLNDLGEMFPGATSSGNECVSVPADQIEGGAWIVEESFSFDNTRVFFALS